MNSTDSKPNLRICVKPPPGPKSGCGDRKRTYDSIREARQAAAYSWCQTGCNLAVYKCPQCGKFHLTHLLRGVHSGGRARFVQQTNFSGWKTPKMLEGWKDDGAMPKTKEEIEQQRAAFKAEYKARKAHINQVRRRIRWRDREESDDLT